MADSDDAPRPVLAGRYRLERRVAQGGMAEVYLATDTALTRQVAVKLLKPHLAADPVVAERFRREAVAVAGLTHPNIVAVYDAVEYEGRQAVVMQYVAGKTLRQLLDEQGRLSPDLTVHIGCAVASALDAAHQAGLVHRDVKPGNILITPEGRVQLADFGIAKALGGGGGDLTSDNVMMGTAKYLSPEQVRGRRLDGRADLYSLGLVLYECLAGKVPFLGESDADTALARLQRDPTDLGRLRPTLPRHLVDVIHQLLNRDPAHRYATGSAVRAALSKAAERIAPPAVAAADATNVMPDGRAGAHYTIDTTPSHGPSAKLSDTAARAPTLSPTRPDTARRAPTPTEVAALDPGLRTHKRSPPRPVPTGTGRPTDPRMQQRWAPSIYIIGILLVVAVVVAVVLWITISADNAGPNSVGPDTAVQAPATDAAPVVAASPPPTDVHGTDAAPRRVGIAGVASFDPDGSDTAENDADTGLAVDDDPSTAWTTVCYGDRFFGAKRGVGLVVALSAPTGGQVTVRSATGPWNIDVFATGGTRPDRLEGWGAPIAQDHDLEPGIATATLPGGSRYLLVMMHELARDPGCSAENPYRGGLADVTVVAA